jgi:hypothetical protein
MGERIDASALVGTWKLVDPVRPGVWIFAADGRCEMEVPKPDLAGYAMSFRAIGGEWVLEGDRLRITLRFTGESAGAESDLEYLVAEFGERLGLRGVGDKVGEVAYFERLGRV